MDVDTVWSGVVSNKILLKLADSTNCALENFLDKDSLLRMDHLIIALLELSVDLNILDVQASQMMENIIVRPC